MVEVAQPAPVVEVVEDPIPVVEEIPEPVVEKPVEPVKKAVDADGNINYKNLWDVFKK